MTASRNGIRPTMLTKLIQTANEQTARRRTLKPLSEMVALASTAPAARDFAAALREPGLSVIAEMKPRSPSKGPLTDDYRPAERARAYQRGAAAAISVLTHEDGFGGSPEHLPIARTEGGIPVLRKDFIDDEYQIVEARALGADALLLIVASLTPERLAELLAYTRGLGMEALVEVHDEEEVDVALDAGATVIGVNHRDLRDFRIDMTLTARLRHRVGPGRLLVGESGINTVRDAVAMREAGAAAVLVGEVLMRAADPEAKVRELSNA
ncbi:indole-3-glycerol phosphate synthase TrpC [Kibdelosporangium phytohabitans]|nr:indole-3-glycerol phosphate synthase TrpC [Kibdelosporangium phytohabitans]MBE1469600.1 indole-3-glycerol phosphate synthase [Kibdelosporangium phytohabitans]